MTPTVHTYIRRRGQNAEEPVDLNYLATGKHLQEDLRKLADHHLPQPDLLRGIIHCQSLAEAQRIISLGVHGLYTREVEIAGDDQFFADHPEMIGPPRIQLKKPRLAKTSE